MSPKLEHKLIEKYPKLFKNVNKSPKESLMCFGMECGDGWYNILENLCGYIENLQKTHSYFLATKDKNDKHADFHCPDVTFFQIKEKYGTLRVYWNFGEWDHEDLKSRAKDAKQLNYYLNKYTDMIESVISFCEYLSSKTCEVTGKPGKLYSKGWCVTLCKEEAIKRFGYDPNEDLEEENEEIPKL
jgi:hypothetical protein